MGAKQIWLSYPLAVDDPRPPAIPAPELSDLYTVAKDGANVQILRVASHTGTHLDAPRHVISDGAVITDFPPEELLFERPAVIDIATGDGKTVTPDDLSPFARKLTGADLALFRFGYGKIRSRDPVRFSHRCPGFGVPAGRWLREQAPSLRAIGLDVPSVACIAHLDETMTVHEELLGGTNRRFLIIEDMDLDHDLTQLTRVQVCPWRVHGMDSGPCSVIGYLEPGVSMGVAQTR
jgi:arylformamidase